MISAGAEGIRLFEDGGEREKDKAAAVCQGKTFHIDRVPAPRRGPSLFLSVVIRPWGVIRHCVL